MTENLLLRNGVDVFGQAGFHIRRFIPMDDFFLGSLINNRKNILQFTFGVGLITSGFEVFDCFFHGRGDRPICNSFLGRCAHSLLARFVMWQTKTLSYLLI